MIALLSKGSNYLYQMIVAAILAMTTAILILMAIAAAVIRAAAIVAGITHDGMVFLSDLISIIVSCVILPCLAAMNSIGHIITQELVGIYAKIFLMASATVQRMLTAIILILA